MTNAINLALLAMLLTTSMAFAANEEEHHAKHAESAPAAAEYKYKTPKLNKAQFDALLAKPEQLTIIDVRRPDELSSKGGFPVYLSIQAGDIEKSLAFIPKERNIVTVSNHAGRAGAAADVLAGKGFKVVGAVGAQNYEQEGGTLSKIVPPEPKK